MYNSCNYRYSDFYYLISFLMSSIESYLSNKPKQCILTNVFFFVTTFTTFAPCVFVYFWILIQLSIGEKCIVSHVGNGRLLHTRLERSAWIQLGNVFLVWKSFTKIGCHRSYVEHHTWMWSETKNYYIGKWFWTR